MFRTKGMTGFTLYPGKAYLEIKAKLYNRTNLPADIFVVGKSGGGSE